MHPSSHQAHVSGRALLSAAVLCFVLLAGTSALPAESGKSPESEGDAKRRLLAGAAASNITPPLGAPIVGGWSPRPATHVHDELHAKCLVLDDGQTRLAIVICDNVGIPREVYDAAKQRLAETTEIPVEHMLMAADHTHSAASARGPNKVRREETLTDYQQFVVSRIADGVRCAENNLEPARIGWGSAEEPSQVFNRRWHIKPGTPVPNPFGGEDKVRMNPGRGNPNLLEPAGPVDPEIACLSVQSTDGRPIALLANYSLHYVGGVRSGDISADYFGMFADRIQQLLGADRLDPPFVGMMSNGTSGDVNNINFRVKGERLPRYAKMREVANLVAQKVYEAHQGIAFHDWVPLAARQRELSLAVRKPTDEQLDYARQILAKPANAKPYHVRERNYAERAIQLAESPDEVSAILQAFRIGDVGIAAIPFEVFAQIGLELKEKSPLPRQFTISLANGSYGYLPTVRQHALGGYETWLGTCNVEIEAAPKIVDALLAMLEELK
jgi:hypothetical protein